MQKRKNDVKARTTLLMALPDEHQLRFSKHKTAQELWAAILKTFGGNEATKKTKKNLLKQPYDNFKAEGSETLEQTFNRFSGNEEVNTASTNVSTDSANIRAASISQDTACAYIASQSSGSQIKFKDINQINEDDMEEIDIKWNMALLSMRADRYWKKTGKKITIQVTDVTPKALMAVDGVGWDWIYIAIDEENHALVADEEAPTEFALMAKTSAETKVFDNSLCSKAWLTQFKARLAEHRNQEVKYYEKIRVLEFKTKSRANCIESLTNLLESQRLDKNKEGLGYSVVPPPPSQVYSPPKKDLSWTGLQEFADNIVTDYSRPASTIESFPNDAQNRNPSVTETEASPNTISPKPFIKFVKATDRLTKTKTAKVKTAKPVIKYAAIYSKPSKSSKSSSQNNIDEKAIGTVDALGTCQVTYPTSLIMSHLMEDMCLLLKEDARLLANGLSKPDETSGILRKFITKIENLKDLKVKIIRCDNEGEFRNKEMNDFCSQKGIKREFSNARTPQQNGVAEKRNKILIEAARTMLADAKLPVTFWAEAVNTACYVQNRVLVNKSQNKTPYELFNGRTHAIGFLKPFGCHVRILNTLDNLGKFEAKADEGTKDAGRQEVKKDVSFLRYIALPNWIHEVHLESSLMETPIPTVSLPVPTACLNDSPESSSDTRLISKRVANQVDIPSLDNILKLTNRFEDILRVTTYSDESNRVEANVSNMETTITASPTPTLRIHKDHPKSQIIGPVDTPIQTRHKSKEVGEQSFIATIHQKTDPTLL
nr:retrovirus-related Pol polyprotein from transposon TNT 1-94 [Tanacetum cinerariifolium]